MEGRWEGGERVRRLWCFLGGRSGRYTLWIFVLGWSGRIGTSDRYLLSFFSFVMSDGVFITSRA